VIEWGVLCRSVRRSTSVTGDGTVRARSHYRATRPAGRLTRAPAAQVARDTRSRVRPGDLTTE